jgi:hypothetical protein
MPALSLSDDAEGARDDPSSVDLLSTIVELLAASTLSVPSSIIAPSLMGSSVSSLAAVPHAAVAGSHLSHPASSAPCDSTVHHPTPPETIPVESSDSYVVSPVRAHASVATVPPPVPWKPLRASASEFVPRFVSKTAATEISPAAFSIPTASGCGVIIDASSGHVVPPPALPLSAPLRTTHRNTWLPSTGSADASHTLFSTPIMTSLGGYHHHRDNAHISSTGHRDASASASTRAGMGAACWGVGVPATPSGSQPPIRFTRSTTPASIRR